MAKKKDKKSVLLKILGNAPNLEALPKEAREALNALGMGGAKGICNDDVISASLVAAAMSNLASHKYLDELLERAGVSDNSDVLAGILEAVKNIE
ncbi:hypothetical protein AGMMS49975_02810 [Clostridia bacterium]|nr:hypothetical protein AGMMS49975_02810 [Clostridia bacterium]